MRRTPQQDRLVALVGFRRGITTFHAAREIGPSVAFGYATIGRAVSSGRIVRVQDPARVNRASRLYLPSDVPPNAQIWT